MLVKETDHMPADTVASRKEVLDFLGVKSCKLVFRRWYPKKQFDSDYFKGVREATSRLCFVDFSVPNPRVTETGAVRPFSPAFHPDGTRIVFSVSFAASDMYIQPLAPDAPAVKIGTGAYPTFWIDPGSGDTWVVYRTICEASKTDHPGETMKMKVDPRTNEPIGEPELVYPKGFTGGLSPDGRWLATAIHWLTIADLSTGTEYHPIDNNQACNITHSPGSGGHVLHLCADHRFFGSIRFDKTDKIVYEAPAGIQEFQTPKWSNHPDFAAIVGANDSWKYDVYIVRLSDQSYIKAVSGDSYVHANLWCEL
ncbi:MAG: hypothetical protein GF418_17015 [Chitinivibrionales bacterium]|nr:hypothetical protein [Chitinivibrionales bacterium]MBD3397322.1 hypothetical protein [Chitinivibrionales bacterium]